MAGQFRGDVARGARIGGEIGKHGEALRLPFLRINAAGDVARAGFVDRLDEVEIARPAVAAEQALQRPAGQPLDGPAGEHPREFGDVGLAVAAVHAERVQLQYLPGEILVQAAPLAAESGGALADARIGADRLGLVEIEQHGRMPLDGDQHVAELAEHVRPDRLELEQAGHADHRQFVGGNREMVRPEMDHALDEWGRRDEGSVGAGADHGEIILPADAADEAAGGIGQAGQLVAGLHAGGRGARRGGLHAHGGLRLGLGRRLPPAHPRARGRAAGCLAVRAGRLRLAASHFPTGLPRLFQIVGELGGDLRALRCRGDRLGPGIVTVELRDDRPPRIGRRHIVAAGAETEAVKSEGLIRHRRDSPTQVIASAGRRTMTFSSQNVPARDSLRAWARTWRQTPSRHAELDSASMNTVCENSRIPCSWILTFVRMTRGGAMTCASRSWRRPQSVVAVSTRVR